MPERETRVQVSLTGLAPPRQQVISQARREVKRTESRSTNSSPKQLSPTPRSQSLSPPPQAAQLVSAFPVRGKLVNVRVVSPTLVAVGAAELAVDAPITLAAGAEAEASPGAIYLHAQPSQVELLCAV